MNKYDPQLISTVAISKVVAARLKEMSLALEISQRELAEKLITAAYSTYVVAVKERDNENQ